MKAKTRSKVRAKATARKPVRKNARVVKKQQPRKGGRMAKQKHKSGSSSNEPVFFSYDSLQVSTVLEGKGKGTLTFSNCEIGKEESSLVFLPDSGEFFLVQDGDTHALENVTLTALLPKGVSVGEEGGAEDDESDEDDEAPRGRKAKKSRGRDPDDDEEEEEPEEDNEVDDEEEEYTGTDDDEEEEPADDDDDEIADDDDDEEDEAPRRGSKKHGRR